VVNAGQSNRRYVFVCGLPRSGTSILGRNIARMEHCTGFRDTGFLEDEGRFLQDVYPTEDDCGGPGRFGFDERAHLTETSALLTPANVAKLQASWHAHWDNNKTIFVEKTPANLLMTRFLQAAFPNSYFVVIKRHPIPVGMAAQKWKLSSTSLDNMFAHWLHCHALYEQDKQYLKHVYELRYEDYVENPQRYHQEIADFIGTRLPESPKDDTFRTVAQWNNPSGLRVPEHSMEEPSRAYNKKYFDRWRHLLTNSPFKYYYWHIARKYESSFAEFGYSLTRESGMGEEVHRHRCRVPAGVGVVCCLGADIWCFLVRSTFWFIWQLKKGLRAVMPEPVKIRIKRGLQKLFSNRDEPGMVAYKGCKTATFATASHRASPKTKPRLRPGVGVRTNQGISNAIDNCAESSDSFSR
jgi:hypothetical protein